MSHAQITPIAVDQSLYFAVTDHVAGASYRVDVGGAPGVGAAEWHLPDDRIALSVTGTAGTVAPQVLEIAGQSLASAQGMLGQTGLQADLVTLVSASVGGVPYIVAARADGAGLSSFAANGAAPTLAANRADSADAYLANVSDLAVVETDLGLFIAAGSATEHGLSLYRLGSNGSLNGTDHLGQEDSLPVQGVTALEAVSVDGRDYLIAAAAGSSSLTVLSVSSSGQMSVVDHVFDALPTRFAGASQLSTAEIDGQVFVITSGQDDGLSLFRLTAEGRLVHQQSLADQNDLALDNVSGLGAVATADGIAVLTSSATEPGLGLYRVDIAPGVVIAQIGGTVTGGAADDLLSLTQDAGRIEGGAGRDLISDGPGADRLTGGAGADTFLMRADGQRDVITDIRPGEDVLDLGLWPFLYSADQLTVTGTQTGAVVTFGGEELELQSWNGSTLDRGDIETLLAVGPGRVAVQTGPLQVAELPADPDPFPDSVPGPDPLPSAPPPDDADDADDVTPVAPVQPQPAPTPGGSVLEGGEGADVLAGGNGDDMVGGRGGNDTLRGNGGDDTVAGADGDDRVLGGPGRDNLGGGPGNDRIEGGPGNDTLGGGLGDDDMHGEDGNDAASGGPGDDTIEGGAGDDALAGSFGNDVVKGNDGDDALGGGTGRDRLVGGAGQDSLGGGEGDDTVKGGEGHDVVMGEAGDDRLNGGAGHDTLTGGAGADMFIFNALNDGERDTITDFENGADILRIGGLPGQGQAGRFDALDITDTAAGAEIAWGGHTILLEGVAAGSLGAEDFVLT